MYDEPYPDPSEKLVAKQNTFIMCIDVNPTTKVPEKIALIDSAKDATFMSTRFIKALSYEVINQNLYASIFDANRNIKMYKCALVTSSATDLKTNCAILPHRLNITYGLVTIMRSGLVGIFDRHNWKIQFCSLKDTDTVNVLDKCQFYQKRRDDSDLDVRTFESYKADIGFVIYTNKLKTKSLGIDRVDVAKTDPNL